VHTHLHTRPTHTQEGAGFHTGAFRPQQGKFSLWKQTRVGRDEQGESRERPLQSLFRNQNPVRAHTRAGGTGRTTREDTGLLIIRSDGGSVIPVPTAHGPQPRERDRELGAQGGIQKGDLLLPKPSRPTQILVLNAKVTVPEDHYQLEPPPFRARRKGKKRQRPRLRPPGGAAPPSSGRGHGEAGQAGLGSLSPVGAKGQAGWEGLQLPEHVWESRGIAASRVTG